MDGLAPVCPSRPRPWSLPLGRLGSFISMNIGLNSKNIQNNNDRDLLSFALTDVILFNILTAVKATDTVILNKLLLG